MTLANLPILASYKRDPLRLSWHFFVIVISLKPSFPSIKREFQVMKPHTSVSRSATAAHLA